MLLRDVRAKRRPADRPAAKQPQELSPHLRTHMRASVSNRTCITYVRVLYTNVFIYSHIPKRLRKSVNYLCI